MQKDNRKNRLPPITEMLLAEDKWISKPSGVKGILARLFRKILIDMNMKPSQFNALMNDYILAIRSGASNDPNEIGTQTSMRGNLIKEFIRNRMTWPVFLKALRFLKLLRVRFIVQAYHANGTMTEHYTDVDLGSGSSLSRFLAQVEEDDDDEEEVRTGKQEDMDFWDDKKEESPSPEKSSDAPYLRLGSNKRDNSTTLH